MRAEWTAFAVLIQAAPILAGRLSRTVRKDTDGTVRENYLVGTPSRPDRLDDDRYSAPQGFESGRRFTWDVRVVAVDPDGLDLLSEELMKQLIGKTLNVPGRACSPIRLVEDVEEGDGYDRVADLHYRDFSFRFWSRR